MNMPNELIVFLLSMVPTFEARFTIPLGILEFQMPPATTYILAALGTTFATLLALIFLYKIVPCIKWKWLNKLLDKIFEFTKKRNLKLLNSFKDLSIITFVAIPLPGTGIYGGSIICYLMGVNAKKAFILNIIGMLISAGITTAVSLRVISIFGH